MVEYLCYRCGYMGKQKIHLKNHLNRKNICKPTLDDVSIKEIKKYYELETSTKIHKNPQNLHNFPQNLHKIPQFWIVKECAYIVIRNFLGVIV